jgi:hypothetical protein
MFSSELDKYSLYKEIPIEYTEFTHLCHLRLWVAILPLFSLLINVGSTALLLVANHMSTIIIGSTFFPLAIVSRITFLGINFRNFPHGKSVRQNMIKRNSWLVGLWCLTLLSTIFQLYRVSHFYWWRKLDYPERKPPTCRISLKTFQYNVVSSTHRLCGTRAHNFSCDRHWLHR